MHPEKFGIEKAQISGKYLPAKYFQVYHARRQVQTLVASSGTNQTLYAGTDTGIYRSQDNGKTWHQTNQGLFNMDIRSIMIDPQEPDIVYAGTLRGVFKSEDAGDSWSDWFAESTGFKNTLINDLAIHPDNSDQLLAATDGGVYQSFDGGESWEPLYTEHSIKIVQYSLSNPDTIYASGEHGIIRSQNGGREWNVVWGNALPALTLLETLNTDPEFIYAGTQTGLHKSFNSGRNWVNDPNFKKTHITSLFVNPSNLSQIDAGNEENIYSSTNGGDSWQKLSPVTQSLNDTSGTSVDIKITRIIRSNENTLYAGTTAGLFFSDDDGKTWNSIDLSGAVNQLSPDEMKMDVVKLITEIHNGRFFGSYFYMLVDLATMGIILLTLSGLMIAYYRAKIKSRKKLVEDLPVDSVIQLTETTHELSSESQEIHDMIEHITEHIEKCRMVYMDKEKKEIEEIGRHLNILDKKMHVMMENLGDLEKASED